MMSVHQNLGAFALCVTLLGCGGPRDAAEPASSGASASAVASSSARPADSTVGADSSQQGSSRVWNSETSDPPSGDGRIDPVRCADRDVQDELAAITVPDADSGCVELEDDLRVVSAWLRHPSPPSVDWTVVLFRGRTRLGGKTLTVKSVNPDVDAMLASADDITLGANRQSGLTRVELMLAVGEDYRTVQEVVMLFDDANPSKSAGFVYLGPGNRLQSEMDACFRSTLLEFSLTRKVSAGPPTLEATRTTEVTFNDPGLDAALASQLRRGCPPDKPRTSKQQLSITK
ncbi:MAG: hypothetical protein U0271_47415 [Polyangiaceae bacterium]